MTEATRATDVTTEATAAASRTAIRTTTATV